MINIGIGVAWKINKGSASSYVNSLVLAFEDRVAAAGGIFEAETCLRATLTVLNNIN